MAEIQVGEYLIDLDVVIPSGTQPVDFNVSLIDNNEIKQTKVFMFGKSAIGTKQTIEKAFKITEGGEHTIFFRGVTENPWGKSDPFESSALSFELIPSVIPISLKDDWVMYCDDRSKESGVAVSDFKAKGWNIIKQKQVEPRAEAARDWGVFTTGEYKSNPSICIIGPDQTPIYPVQKPYYWAHLLYSPTHVAGKCDCDDLIYGNGGKIYDAGKYALVRYVIHNGRAVVLDWDSGDHIYMGSDWHRTVWLEIAKLRSAVVYTWYIYNKVEI